jgi:F-type H+-transporting ATPase subunit a
VTHSAVLAAACESGDSGFCAPSPTNFLGTGHMLLWKSSILVIVAAVIVALFFLLATRRSALVPSRFQWIGESAYSFVRDSIARDTLGEHEFVKFVPLLVTSFFFILVNNLFGMVPGIQFPSFSRASFAYAMAGLVWVIYNGVGVKRHGPLRYLKVQCVPSGLPVWIMPLLIPLEFLSNIIIRPITLSLRLFANMFAGHLLIILFALGGNYLLFHATGLFTKPAGVLSFALGIGVGFIEILVEFLQAYVFTLLTASYISGALASEH